MASRSEGPWTKVGVIITAVGVCFGGIGAAVAFFPDWRSKPTSVVGGTTEPGPAKTDGSDSNPQSGPMANASVPDCSKEGVLRQWGLDTTIEAVAITTTVHDGRCDVAPTEAAKAGGASQTDIEKASRGDVSSALRECGRSEQSPVIACSEGHAIEYVGGTLADADNADADEVCRNRGSEYASSTLSIATSLRSVVIGQQGGKSRCAVEPDWGSLSNTVRDIGGKPLPR